MGDRSNPIKFGPEWLRNMNTQSRERITGNYGNNSQNSAAATGGAGAAAAMGSAGGGTSNTTAGTTPATTPKVQLAKLRYGREEMLALYDRNSEAPAELKYIDVLYQPRGKLPIALNLTFEEEANATRPGPQLGGMSPGERFGQIRGLNRVAPSSEGRARSRLPFQRQTSVGRMPGFGGSPAEDDTSLGLRTWNNNNGGNAPNRNSGDQSEWTLNKMFIRNKRPGTSSNWRQSRDEEEWRSSEASRPAAGRSTQQEKWDRDWDRPTQDKPTWNNNRRTWVAGDSQNEDNLPEWAVDNAEACGGTFDASGAFHGYSSDDTNLPKNQEQSAYLLTRSHTHGSFGRSKAADEGSEEWWASEKAKKLSPKRFDAADMKFNYNKKLQSKSDVNTTTSNKTTKDGNSKGTETSDIPVAAPVNPENKHGSVEDNFNKKNVRFAESKTFDSLMRSDVNMDEANDGRSNFQSVMITPNNSLRQKHQNIVAANVNTKPRGIVKLSRRSQTKGTAENDHSKEEFTLEEMERHVTEASAAVAAEISTALAAINVGILMDKIPATQMRIPSPSVQNPGLTNTNISGPVSSVTNVGVTNSALNASLGLPIGPATAIGHSLRSQGSSSAIHPNQTIQPSGASLTGYQASSGVPGLNGPNNSLFHGPSANNNSLQSSSDIPMPNHASQANLFPLHGLQQSASRTAFNSSMYNNLMQQSSPTNPLPPSPADQWYYEDPNKIVQGPFSSKDMYNWYRAGFFSPGLLLRRACETVMRPLGSYGPVVPFGMVELYPLPMSTSYGTDGTDGHDSMHAAGLGLDVMNMQNMTDLNPIDTMQYGNVGLMQTPPFGQQQQQMVDSLWSQPPSNHDMMWMQQAMNARNETRVNNLPMFFWDQMPSAMPSNCVLPEEITKDKMKTEDEILAQLRASQNVQMPNVNLPFLQDKPEAAAIAKNPENFAVNVNPPLNLEELHKFIDVNPVTENTAPDVKDDLQNELPGVVDTTAINQTQSLTEAEAKTCKQTKPDIDKITKNKDNNGTKSKNKKTKDDKKEDTFDAKSKEEEINNKIEKRSEESSPTKNKKDEKFIKKELEKEKKEWIKEGFTIVKGPEKNSNKDSKKKSEEAKSTEEAELKRKEEERLAHEEKKRKQVETTKRQQEGQVQQQQRPSTESLVKKAPWSAIGSQGPQASNKDGPTLAEIQRLEREKKLEQMKEQQQMMQIIAQQQAAALAREQEMQAGLGWNKKKGTNASGQSLTEIQAETRKQATVTQVQVEDVQVVSPVNSAVWSNTHNGGFWDSPSVQQPQKTAEVPKSQEQLKSKKKVSLNIPPYKETPPIVDFENWCSAVLASWSTKIDVPTFVGFLKDIESPYEVKDYVKCYLGDTKETSDFARHFLERRSKLLRVGMVTPSDDLCSPAIAVNPRTTSGSDYQEVKAKAKKTKKRMLKVDARILGFSVTAAEDRINVGDIDTV